MPGILVDNGSRERLLPGHEGWTVWLVPGVRVVHSRPHPQTLGKLERFHRSLKTELLQGSKYTDLSHCQSSFDRWRDFYNLQRPHHALDLDTPARIHHQPSAFPETLPAVESKMTRYAPSSTAEYPSWVDHSPSVKPSETGGSR